MSFLVKGENKGSEIQPFTIEQIDSLSVEDGEFLASKVNEITSKSSLSKEAKKK